MTGSAVKDNRLIAERNHKLRTLAKRANEKLSSGYYGPYDIVKNERKSGTQGAFSSSPCNTS